MTAFWVIAGSMLACALLCVVRPLLHGSGDARERGSRALLVALYQGELARADAEFHAGTLSRELYAATRSEIEARLLDEVESARLHENRKSPGIATRAVTAALLIALIPAASFAMYLHLGEPAALTLDASPGDQHDMASGSLELMVSRLAMRLRQQSGSAEDWAMLARSYFALDRPADASVAYARAVALAPRDAQLRADYADAIASARSAGLSDEALTQIDAALELDSSNPKALALAGSAALDRRDYTAAIGYWERLEATLAPGTPAAAQARRNLDEARAMLAGPPPAAGR